MPTREELQDIISSTASENASIRTVLAFENLMSRFGIDVDEKYGLSEVAESEQVVWADVEDGHPRAGFRLFAMLDESTDATPEAFIVGTKIQSLIDASKMNTAAAPFDAIAALTPDISADELIAYVVRNNASLLEQANNIVLEWFQPVIDEHASMIAGDSDEALE